MPVRKKPKIVPKKEKLDPEIQQFLTGDASAASTDVSTDVSSADEGGT